MKSDGEPTVVRLDDAAAFLDAPGVDADTLFEAIGRVLATMTCEAILAVFTDDASATTAAPAWCAAHRVDLVALIRHDTGGATLAVRRIDA